MDLCLIYLTACILTVFNPSHTRHTRVYHYEIMLLVSFETPEQMIPFQVHESPSLGFLQSWVQSGDLRLRKLEIIFKKVHPCSPIII